MSVGEWELFRQVGAKFKSRASISATGAISFTQGAALEFKIDKEHHKFARLYYNSAAKKIGISFAEADGDHTIKTNFRSDTGFWFSGKAFLTFFGIMPKTTCLYDSIYWDNESSMLIIELNSARVRKKAKKEEKCMEQSAITNSPGLF
ncbi:MAG: hypothetical protein LBE13_22345 [Bacteroidales bacterium]|jgi:hypothetical protein|nr:hypothetical protein [Bacteroidales bacterium]